MAETEGMLSGLARVEVAGIPLGAAATGAAVAGLFDALMGVVPAGVPVWAIKGVASMVAIKWGPRYLGTIPAQTAGLFLAYDAIQEMFNLRGTVTNIFSGLVGKVTKHSPLEALGPQPRTSPIVIDYYAMAEARR